MQEGKKARRAQKKKDEEELKALREEKENHFSGEKN